MDDIFPDIFPEMPLPGWGLEDSTVEDVERVELGDGYVYVQPAGLNYQKSQWNPVWELEDEDLPRLIYAWLKARKLITPFPWRHPDGTVYVVRCEDVKLVWEGFNQYTLSVAFTEDFSPI